MDKKKLQAIRDFINNAEMSLRSAKRIMKEMLDEEGIPDSAWPDLQTNGLHTYKSGESKIIEWVFTWDEMLWVDGHKYPVPVNYSSKSKLVQGDKMKLTIEADGRMLYKQILPIERETKVWLLARDQGKYQVLADGISYYVLTAAVTHFKAEIGDTVTILVPKWKEATFAAIEAVIPKE
jgi:hypothetical protein